MERSLTLILHLASACLLFLAACVPDDAGKPCPAPMSEAFFAEPPPPQEADLLTSALRTDSRCEAGLCASSAIRADYCTLECYTNDHCPGGFSCTTLTPTAPASEKRYCLLVKPCGPSTASVDCRGSVCVEMATADPNKTVFFCDMRE